MSSKDDLLDRVSCERAGVLAAYDLLDQQICDTLLIVPEQLEWARAQPDFVQAYQAKKQARLQSSIDREDGWDMAEEMALEQIIQAMRYNRDPRYALMVASRANMAKRRTTSGPVNRVIETQKAGNIIVLNLGRRYVEKQENGEQKAVLDVKPREELPQLEHRQSDIPTPKRVAELLKVGSSAKSTFEEDQIERELMEAGVFIEK